MSNTFTPPGPAGAAPALPDLPGFNTAAALKLLNNNQKLYGNVLKSFLRQYEPALERLSALFCALPSGADEWTVVQREAHTIKGLAGTIGHTALQEAAIKYDAAAKAPAEHDQS